MVSRVTENLIRDGELPNFKDWLTRLNSLFDKKISLSEQRRLCDAFEFLRRHDAHTAVANSGSGDEIAIYALELLDILAELRLDTDTLIAAMLHTLQEKQLVSDGLIHEKFGASVSKLIDGVCKLEFMRDLERTPPQVRQQQTDNLHKMLVAVVEDARVVLIKLAERLLDMRLLRHLPVLHQQGVAQETLEVFTPLANRLGIWQLKWEMEDLSLRYLQPDAYKGIAKLLDDKRVDRENYIARMIQLLQDELDRAGINAAVMGRPKHIYSIWRKMQRKNLSFHELFDVLGIRVLVDKLSDCYAVLGIVHKSWLPIRTEFDDYIAAPKPNGYQSLHTVVVGPRQKSFEVQIRTRDMHQHAELGIAAHWRYKEGRAEDSKFDQKILWLRQLLEAPDKEELLMEQVDFSLTDSRIYVLSPKGRVVDLPQGATPLDFAYYIHTELGHRCRGAKANGRIVSLSYELKTGDQVEILRGRQARPSRDWVSSQLGYLKTPRAQAKVRAWLKQQDKKQHISTGRAMLEQELRRLNITNYELEAVAASLNLPSEEDCFAALGRGDLNIEQIINLLQASILPEEDVRVYPSRAKQGQTDVHIHGVDGLMTRTAMCCKPLPNDPIIGYITQGTGVAVHRLDCHHVQHWREENSERLIAASWHRPEGRVYPVDIYLEAFDYTGLMRDISQIFTNARINITAISTQTGRDNIARMTLALEVDSIEQLSRALLHVDNLPNTLKIERKHHS
ncbi:MAG: bifunctional (p)ppGpp synthetase/guanosine-3',5'-bis(diphosphate) 3'-pyrophosphohydrolase [Pseudomonadota bacterium]